MADDICTYQRKIRLTRSKFSKYFAQSRENYWIFYKASNSKVICSHELSFDIQIMCYRTVHANELIHLIANIKRNFYTDIYCNIQSFADKLMSYEVLSHVDDIKNTHIGNMFLKIMMRIIQKTISTVQYLKYLDTYFRTGY